MVWYAQLVPKPSRPEFKSEYELFVEIPYTTMYSKRHTAWLSLVTYFFPGFLTSNSLSHFPFSALKGYLV